MSISQQFIVIVTYKIKTGFEGRIERNERINMPYAIWATILVVSFLIMVNMSLGGRLNDRIRGFLAIVNFSLVGCSFYFYGWKYGLGSIIVFFAAAIFLRRCAERIAAYLLYRLNPESPAENFSFVNPPQGELKRISLILGDTTMPTLDDLYGAKDSDRDAVDDLYDYCFSHAETSDMLAEYNIDREDIDAIYNKLISHGAGQFLGSHYVPASSLAMAEPLRYLLENDSEDQKKWEQLTFNLMMYFERGEPLMPIE